MLRGCDSIIECTCRTTRGSSSSGRSIKTNCRAISPTTTANSSSRTTPRASSPRRPTTSSSRPKAAPVLSRSSCRSMRSARPRTWSSPTASARRTRRAGSCWARSRSTRCRRLSNCRPGPLATWRPSSRAKTKCTPTMTWRSAFSSSAMKSRRSRARRDASSRRTATRAA